MAGFSSPMPERSELTRKLILGLCLGPVASVASADGVQNKRRLEVSGNTGSTGRIVLQLAPAEGDPFTATAVIPKRARRERRGQGYPQRAANGGGQTL